MPTNSLNSPNLSSPGEVSKPKKGDRVKTPTGENGLLVTKVNDDNWIIYTGEGFQEVSEGEINGGKPDRFLEKADNSVSEENFATPQNFHDLQMEGGRYWGVGEELFGPGGLFGPPKSTSLSDPPRPKETGDSNSTNTTLATEGFEFKIDDRVRTARGETGIIVEQTKSRKWRVDFGEGKFKEFWARDIASALPEGYEFEIGDVVRDRFTQKIGKISNFLEGGRYEGEPVARIQLLKEEGERYFKLLDLVPTIGECLFEPGDLVEDQLGHRGVVESVEKKLEGGGFTSVLPASQNAHFPTRKANYDTTTLAPAVEWGENGAIRTLEKTADEFPALNIDLAMGVRFQKPNGDIGIVTDLINWRAECLSNLTCAAGSESASPWLEPPLGFVSSDSQKPMSIVEESSGKDFPKPLFMETLTTSLGKPSTSQISLQLPPPASPFQLEESGEERATIATASPQFFERSNLSDQDMSRSKMLGDYSPAPTDPENPENTLAMYSKSFPASGTMSNGTWSIAAPLERPSLESGCSWLPSPTGLSSKDRKSTRLNSSHT